MALKLEAQYYVKQTDEWIRSHILGQIYPVWMSLNPEPMGDSHSKWQAQ